MSTRTRARAGNYNHLVSVLQQSVTQDTFGQEHRTWPVWVQIYAAKEPEYRPTDIFVETSAAHHYEQKIWFRTRKDHPFNQETMRLRDEEGDYEILAIEDPAGRNEEVRLLCRKVQP